MEKLSQLIENGKNLYSAKEFMAKLRITKSTLWRWEKEGRVKCIRVGRKCYYTDESIIQNQ